MPARTHGLPDTFKGQFYRYMAQIFDVKAHAATFINQAHHEVHEGDMYYLVNSVSLALNETNVISFKTPAVSDPQKRCHLVWEFEGIGSTSTFNILEDVTSISGGTAATPQNHFRGSSNVSACTEVFIGDDTNADAITITGGTSLFPRGSVTAGDGQIAGGGDRGVNELVLKPNSIYCFEHTAGGISTSILKLHWYEHTDAQW